MSRITSAKFNTYEEVKYRLIHLHSASLLKKGTTKVGREIYPLSIQFSCAGNTPHSLIIMINANVTCNCKLVERCFKNRCNFAQYCIRYVSLTKTGCLRALSYVAQSEKDFLFLTGFRNETNGDNFVIVPLYMRKK